MVLYEGCLNTEVRASLLEVLYSLTGCKAISKKEVRRHCGVALEMLDNAQRYGSSEHIRFEWHRTEDGIEIKIINKASKEDAENMIEVLTRINSMSESELKQALMEQLTSGEYGKKGGAGLGFLQIASRGGKYMDARIEPLDNNHYLCESTYKTKIAS